MKYLVLPLSIAILLFLFVPSAVFAQDETTLLVTTDPLNPTIQSVIAGEKISFLITVANTGATDALQPELADSIVNPLPDGARIVDFALVRGGNNFEYVVQGGECTDSGFRNLPDIPAGGFIVAEVTIAQSVVVSHILPVDVTIPTTPTFSRW